MGASGKQRYRLHLSDGINYMNGAIVTQLNGLIESGKLAKGSLVKLKDHIMLSIEGRKVIMIQALEVVGNSKLIGSPSNIEPATSPRSSAPPDTSPRFLRPLPQDSSPFPLTPYLTQARSQTIPPSQLPTINFQDDIESFSSQESQSSQPIATTSRSNHLVPNATIAGLNTYTSKWVIKARCTFKSWMHHFVNKRDGLNTMLFSVHLSDRNGSEIKATMFREAASRLFDKFQEGKVYIISGGKIVPAQKKYANVEHEYEIHLELYSIITEIPDDKEIPEIHFEFVPIAQLEQVPKDQLVDVMAVITEVGLPVIVKTNEKSVLKRTLMLLDVSICCIEFILWGDAAEQNWKVGDYLALKDARIAEYNYRNLVNISTTRRVLNPDIQEAIQLSTWYEAVKDRHLRPKFISSQSSQRVPNMDLGSLIDAVNASNYLVKANVRVTLLSVLDDTSRFWYPACSNPSCSDRKLNQGPQMRYWCGTCQLQVEHPTWKFSLRIHVLDHTGNAWVAVFDEAAQELLEIDATTLQDIEAVDRKEFDDILNRLKGRQYDMTLRAKWEMHNGRQLRMIASKIQAVQYHEGCHGLLRDLHQSGCFL
eukprot:TRINITY_DN185_c3_g1_i1.p1 TRINITY_DN185_c3_g1~~TRINITY_DN185_c3_g1_i1.p1  ORF type:complete len:660 (+),score=174.29 TRINITY_DN185_c3_g1_i1:203-1981(+)